MTSLPIHIPKGYKIVVKKDDVVSTNQILAEAPQKTDSEIPTEPEVEQSTDVVIDLASELNLSPSKVRTMIHKNPGDELKHGDLLASRTKAFGMKREEVFANVSGTILRFERDTGRLVVKSQSQVSTDTSEGAEVLKDVLSPLDGKVTLCNNTEIVLETKTNALSGTAGVGPKVHGTLSTQFFAKAEDEEVTGGLLTPDTIDKVLLVQEIGREALAKAAAIGVLGIIARHVTNDDLMYVQSREINLPVVEIEEAVGKKLEKYDGKVVVLDGKNKSIMIGE